MGPNARVWKVYNQEAMRIDLEKIQGWKEELDSLLVFASLFSAVITTVTSQTSTRLQKDWGEVTSNLMMELISIQRAGFNGNPVDAIPSSQLTPSSEFTPRPSNVVINTLWFISLTLSLSIALAAMVCSQWIRHYMKTSSGSAKSNGEKAAVHHFQFMGLQKWHVAGIIGSLSIYMQLASALFFVGLVIFLHDLSPVLGSIVDVIIALA
ncbi:hypothetical protein K435DRAFT_912422, partial [Dendrothele bispora CBS 962.96]